jgi:hypothetical protein
MGHSSRHYKDQSVNVVSKKRNILHFENYIKQAEVLRGQNAEFWNVWLNAQYEQPSSTPISRPILLPKITIKHTLITIRLK